MLISKGKREWRSCVFPRHLNQGTHNYLALIKNIYDIMYVWDVNHPKKAPLKLTALQQYVFPRNLNHGTHLFAEINYKWPYWSLYHNLRKKIQPLKYQKLLFMIYTQYYVLSINWKYLVVQIMQSLVFPYKSLYSNLFVFWVFWALSIPNKKDWRTRQVVGKIVKNLPDCLTWIRHCEWVCY